MDIYKLKFTRLQNEIFRLVCIKVGKPINQRGIAKLLKVSPTAISKALEGLKIEGLINIEKDLQMNLTLIELNGEDKKVIGLKRVENLKMIYESRIANYLEDKFPGSIIILFGSYSYGEDTIKSDIDIAIIGCNEKKTNLEKFEKMLERDIRINFYESVEKIHKHLRSNIFNGIVLSGRINL